MNIPANVLRAVLIVFIAGVWVLMLAALDGRTSQTGAAALALVGAGLVASRGGSWIPLGVGASLAAVSVLTIGVASAPVTVLVNVVGLLVVTAGGLRLALELLRDGDAAARPVVIGVVGFLVGDYAVVHATAMDSVSALVLVAPVAALLPMAYGAWSSLLEDAPAPAAAQPAPAPAPFATATR